MAGGGGEEGSGLSIWNISTLNSLNRIHTDPLISGGPHLWQYKLHLETWNRLFNQLIKIFTRKRRKWGKQAVRSAVRKVMRSEKRHCHSYHVTRICLGGSTIKNMTQPPPLAWPTPLWLELDYKFESAHFKLAQYWHFTGTRNYGRHKSTFTISFQLSWIPSRRDIQGVDGELLLQLQW